MANIFVRGLKCIFCGKEYGLEYSRLCCTNCKEYKYGSLDVIYDYDRVRDNTRSWKSSHVSTMWQFKELLPVKENSIITLSEGGTPLIKCNSVGKKYGLNNLFIKDEGINPTGSFKDRGISIIVSIAKSLGSKGVTCVSSGNAAVSLSAYAAKAKLDCFVFAPDSISQEKRTQIQIYGAKLILIEGTLERAYEMARFALDEYDYYNCNAAINPFIIEGNKTIAYENWIQLKFKAPDQVIVPIGNGSNLSGIWKGYNELQTLGLIDKLPKMVGIQCSNAAPVYEGFKNSKMNSIPQKITGKECDADGIIAEDSYDAPKALKAIKGSEGIVTTVTNKEIWDALKDLAIHEGIFCEITSATAIAAAKKLSKDGTIDKDENIVCILTGNGLKSISKITKGYLPVIPFNKPDLLREEIESHFKNA